MTTDRRPGTLLRTWRVLRGRCVRCGRRRAVAAVTWADGLHSGTEALCGPCWDAGAGVAQAVALRQRPVPGG